MKGLEGKICRFIEDSFDGLTLYGKKGRIISDRDFVRTTSSKRSVLVEFFDNINGHDGNNSKYKGKCGHCWWCEVRDLKVIEDRYRRL